MKSILNKIAKIKTGNALIISSNRRSLSKAVWSINYLQRMLGQEYLIGACGYGVVIERIR